jgi:hypothetical protein
MGVRPRGPLPDWKPRTPRQRGILADLVARYEQHRAEDTLPRGPRGIFYDLRPNGMGNGVTHRKPDSTRPVKSFGPMEAQPEAVQEVLTLARRAGIVREYWVADGRAPSALVPYFDESAEEVAKSIARRVEDAAEGFALDPQRDQPVYIEVLCEAEDLMPRLDRVAEAYGVPTYSGAGFDGLKAKRAMAERAMERDRATVVLNVGDRDDHGERIYVAAAEDAVAWAGGAGDVSPPELGAPLDVLAADSRRVGSGETASPFLRFYRLALTESQADDLGVLDADGKAEADAIPVPVLDGLLRDAIEALQDPECRESLEAEQERERERVPAAIRDALDHQTNETEE